MRNAVRVYNDGKSGKHNKLLRGRRDKIKLKDADGYFVAVCVKISDEFENME